MIGPVYVENLRLEILSDDGRSRSYAVVGDVVMGWWDSSQAKIRPGFEKYISQQGRTMEPVSELEARFPPRHGPFNFRYEGPSSRYPYIRKGTPEWEQVNDHGCV